MRIGLTGGIGCGKSTVLRLCAEAGWGTFQTDLAARRILETDPAVQAALAAELGPSIFAAGGGIDRAEVARMVFNDSAKLRFLESLLHPRVRAEWTDYATGSSSPIVVEIPLLFEKQLHLEFDLTVCVAASSTAQFTRLRSRGYDDETIRQRIAHQLPLLEKMARADRVVWNNGSLRHARQQVQHLIRAIENDPHF